MSFATRLRLFAFPVGGAVCRMWAFLPLSASAYCGAAHLEAPAGGGLLRGCRRRSKCCGIGRCSELQNSAATLGSDLQNSAAAVSG